MAVAKSSRVKRNHREVKDALKVIFSWLLVMCIICGIAYVGITHEMAVHEDAKLAYNNGICTKCGGHYHLAAVKNKTASNSETSFYFECENCYHVVVMPYLPK